MYYFEGKVGKGKIGSWDACKEDALRREVFYARREQFLKALSSSEKQRLSKLSCKPRDDAAGEKPGSARSDEEDRLFEASLLHQDAMFLESHKGLGNSQKCEVAWLERMGYAYEELDVRAFGL